MLVESLLGRLGGGREALGQSPLMLKLSKVPLAVEVTELACGFAADTFRVEFFLDPTTLFAHGFCAVAVADFVDAGTLLVADVATKAVEIDFRETAS